MPTTDICSRALQWAADDPDRIFCHVLSSGQAHDVSYGALADDAKRYAAIYRERGVRSGNVVLIILRHGPELFPSFLGAMLIGAMPSFLPFLTPKQQPELYWAANRALFTRIAARLLVTWSENLVSMKQALPGFSAEVHLVEDAPRHGAAPDPVLVQREFSGPAFLQHSSGTTGLKKGVVITHEILSAQVEAYAGALALGERDTIASWLPLYHDMGLITGFLMPLMCGVPVVAMDAFEWVLQPASLLDAVAAYRCSLVWLPNFAFHHIRSVAREGQSRDLKCVRAFIDCSEPCKPETLQMFAQRFGDNIGGGLQKLQTCYALAENVFAVTQSRLGEPVPVIRAERRALQENLRVEPAEDDAVQLLSCGTPIAGVRIEIRDTEGRALPDRQVGEITIAGSSLFSGYYKNPEETAKKLADGWYRTRDLGFVSDGALFVTGRMDDLLIVHGINYYAHDIEFAANQVPGVIAGRCVAVGEYKSDGGTAEVVVLAEAEAGAETGSGPQAAQLKRAVKRQVMSETGLLVQHVGIVPRGWLVKTTSGKLSRGENLRRYRELQKQDIERGTAA